MADSEPISGETVAGGVEDRQPPNSSAEADDLSEALAPDAATTDASASATQETSKEGAALDSSLARVATSAPSLATRPRHPKRLMPNWVQWLLPAATLCALLIGVFSALGVQLPSAASVSHGPVTIVPTARGLTCEQDAAWSPDGAQVALLGYRSACPQALTNQYRYEPGLVSVYDAKHGKFLRQFLLDGAIQTALHLHPPAGVTPLTSNSAAMPIIQYQSVLWSAHTQRLAFPFSLDPAPGNANVAVIEGLLVTDSMGAHAHVLSHTVQPGEAYSGEWNLASGIYMPVITPLPPALSYRWNTDGTLTPMPPVASSGAGSTTPTAAAVGRPSQDQVVSVWQPSELRPVVTFGTGGVSSPIAGLYSIQSNVALWSPDGRYVLASVAFTNWMRPNGTATDPLVGVSQQPSFSLLPLHDPAIATAFSQIPYQKAPYDPDIPPIELAWSPNGHMLAVQAPPAEYSDNPHTFNHAVRLYNCLTGKRIVTLIPGIIANGSSDTTRFLRWSPDSSRLLLFDAELGVMTIWQPGPIPRL